MLIDEQALLPGEHMIEVLVAAERLQDYIRVLFLGGSEEYELIVAPQRCQQLYEVRPKFNIDL
jgi:hypothetical protein